MTKWQANYKADVAREENGGDGYDSAQEPLNPSKPLFSEPYPTQQSNGQCHHVSTEKNGTNGNGTVLYSDSTDLDGSLPALPADMVCGIGSYHPPWMQHLANKKVFLAVFCLTSVLQGMYYTYFVSVLTTIEKLFQIQSKTTGIIMSATEMGQIGGALLLTYYGGHGHRPKWISCGMLVFALASFFCSLPHFLYGSALSRSLLHSVNVNDSTMRVNPNLCSLPPSLSGFTEEHNFTTSSPEYVNLSTNFYSSTAAPSNFTHAQSPSAASCHDQESGKRSHITHIVLGIFFVSLLFIGLGSTAVYTLGIPYIDDNVANRDSPLYFAITIGVRILGPVFGFLLGSLCTSFYVNPFEEPMITNKDPRWIGAWWLGLFIVAAALVVASVGMLAFPKRLPGQLKTKSRSNGHASSANSHNNSPSKTTESTPIAGSDSALVPRNGTKNLPSDCSSKRPSLRDFPATMKRLLKNDILLWRTASSVLHILPIAGLYTFLPKYLESQFRLSAPDANMIAGIAGILVMGIGIFASGTYMRIFKPNARFVAGWIAVTALAYAVGMTILMFVGCPITDFSGLHESRKQSLLGSQVYQQLLAESGLEITTPCNTSCDCNQQVFAPICTSDGRTYYSACHAGCHNYTFREVNSERQDIFRDCECLENEITATTGYCPLECSNFFWYICIFSLFVLIHSTSEVGSMLLTLRCVDPKDKAMALGLISFAIGLFGNVPCPIIYGAVVDSACVVWEYTCGTQGACWFYNPSSFRMYFHGMTGAIMFAAFFVDLVVWYKATNIRFHDEDPPHSEELEPMKPSCPQSETTGV